MSTRTGCCGYLRSKFSSRGEDSTPVSREGITITVQGALLAAFLPLCIATTSKNEIFRNALIISVCLLATAFSLSFLLFASSRSPHPTEQAVRQRAGICSRHKQCIWNFSVALTIVAVLVIAVGGLTELKFRPKEAGTPTNSAHMPDSPPMSPFPPPMSDIPPMP